MSPRGAWGGAHSRPTAPRAAARVHLAAIARLCAAPSGAAFPWASGAAFPWAVAENRHSSALWPVPLWV